MMIVEVIDLIPYRGFIPSVNDFWFIVVCLVVRVPFLIPRFLMFSGFDLESEEGRSDLFPESPF